MSGLFDHIPAPNIWIQWKGTDVCCDFHCECGADNHLCNATFAYFIRCGECGRLYEVGSHVRLKLVEGDNEHKNVTFIVGGDNDGMLEESVGT